MGPANLDGAPQGKELLLAIPQYRADAAQRLIQRLSDAAVESAQQRKRRFAVEVLVAPPHTTPLPPPPLEVVLPQQVFSEAESSAHVALRGASVGVVVAADQGVARSIASEREITIVRMRSDAEASRLEWENEGQERAKVDAEMAGACAATQVEAARRLARERQLKEEGDRRFAAEQAEWQRAAQQERDDVLQVTLLASLAMFRPRSLFPLFFALSTVHPGAPGCSCLLWLQATLKGNETCARSRGAQFDRACEKVRREWLSNAFERPHVAVRTHAPLVAQDIACVAVVRMRLCQFPGSSKVRGVPTHPTPYLTACSVLSCPIPSPR